MCPSNAKLIIDNVERTKRPFTTYTREFVFPDQRNAAGLNWTGLPIFDREGEVEYPASS